MLPAANRPILEHVLDALVDAGLDRIVLVVGYRRERVQEYFGPSYRNVPLKYVVQHKQLGSGHALLQAREAVDGPLLVVNGDQITEASAVRAVLSTFAEETAPAVMAVLERRDASKYGAITLRDRDIDAIVEKPNTDEYRLMNGGVYAFEESIFEAIDETERHEGELSLTDTIADLVEKERVRGVRTGGLWVDATYPWDLLEVSAEVLARGRVSEPEAREGVWLDDDARVHDDATLRPPVVVGPDCEIAPGAVVGPDAALGRNVTVGANATVERTVLDSDTRIGAGSTLRDAVIGQDVHMGVETTIPGGPGDVRVDRQVFEARRLGAVVADRARARGNVSFSPGTLVGPNARLGSGTHIGINISEGTEVMR
jgi:glucose-1-phosphate thymidylyltransferase